MTLPALARPLLHRICLTLTLVFVIGFAGTAAAASQHAYVTNAATNTVSVIDTATRTVVGSIPVEVFPVSVAVSPDGATAYVANVGSNFPFQSSTRPPARSSDPFRRTTLRTMSRCPRMARVCM